MVLSCRLFCTHCLHPWFLDVPWFYLSFIWSVVTCSFTHFHPLQQICSSPLALLLVDWKGPPQCEVHGTTKYHLFLKSSAPTCRELSCHHFKVSFDDDFSVSNTQKQQHVTVNDFRTRPCPETKLFLDAMLAAIFRLEKKMQKNNFADEKMKRAK